MNFWYEGWKHSVMDQNQHMKSPQKIHKIFNPFVNPFTIPTFVLYSFLKVYNFLKNGSITVVYNLFSSYISPTRMVNINVILKTFHLLIYFSNHNYVRIGKLLDVHHALGLIECDYWFHNILHIYNIKIFFLDSFFPSL